MNIDELEQVEKEIKNIEKELEATSVNAYKPDNSNSSSGLSVNRVEQKNFADDLEKKTIEFVAKVKPILAILTPCYGGMCNSQYTLCLIDTIKLLENYGIVVKIFFLNNDSLVSRARNNLVGTAMLDKNITHFMFIDSDIIWNPIDIIKLLVSDKQFIGGIYPKKTYKFDKIYSNPSVVTKWIEVKNSISPDVSDEVIVKNNLVDYNLNYLSTNLQIVGNVVELKHIATGFMMLKREVFDLMIMAYPETKYIDDTGFVEPKNSTFTYALFDTGVLDKHYLSEDWMFCERWRKINGSVYADISIDLTHIGTECYQGSLIKNLLTTKM
jgi:hypothetical protein